MTFQEIADLLAKSKTGDRRALDRLVQGYLPLVRSSAATFRRSHPWMVQQDLEQIGLLTIVKAVKAFNPAKGVNFTVYLQTALAFQYRQEEPKYRSKVQVLSGIPEDLPDAADSIEEVCIRCEPLRKQLQMVYQKLDPQKKQVMQLRIIQDKSLMVVAKAMGISFQKVARLEGEIRKQLQLT